MVTCSDTISASFVSKRSRSPEPQPKKITLKVKNQQGEEDIYKIGGHAQLKKLMVAYCKKRNIDYTSVRFIYDHKQLKSRHTPHQLMMEENDEISVVVELGGGGPYAAT
ncbi:unnamed protein product [Cochlearia groenlandica]